MVEISFELFNDNSNNLLRVFIKSAHPNQLSYKAYHELNPEKEGIDSIEGWLCHSKVGLRTVGYYAHTASVIYYFSYSRYRESLKYPSEHIKLIFPEAPAQIDEDFEDEI